MKSKNNNDEIYDKIYKMIEFEDKDRIKINDLVAKRDIIII